MDSGRDSKTPPPYANGMWLTSSLLSEKNSQMQSHTITWYIMICASDKKYLDKPVTSTIKTIQTVGFEIREDKVQYARPWKYLGLQICERTIVPQQLTIRDDRKTLRDLHSL
ncbi:endogenous retrovirus group K member 18 Pol protein-like protein [Turdus rufiventris]|nr:endogenous retrovirus group K member 18 Pol protein-like protein [Turdus rufiventris]